MKTLPTDFEQIPDPLPPPPPPAPSTMGLVPVEATTPPPHRPHHPAPGLVLGACALLSSVWFVMVDSASAVYGVLGTLVVAVPGVLLAWRAGEGTGDDHDRRSANLSGAGVALGVVAIVIAMIELVVR